MNRIIQRRIEKLEMSIVEPGGIESFTDEELEAAIALCKAAADSPERLREVELSLQERGIGHVPVLVAATIAMANGEARP